MSAQASPLPLRIATQATRDPAGWTIRIQKLLKNFNGGNRSPHWAIKNRERQHWQTLIANAIVDAVGVRFALEILTDKSGLPNARGGERRRCRVHVQRLVPSRRQFIRDDFDNLPWSTKELRDALKQLGLIRDDSGRWCEMQITQDVSPDGLPWTVITIETIADRDRDRAPHVGPLSTLIRTLESVTGGPTQCAAPTR